jgi:hypothetical protein
MTSPTTAAQDFKAAFFTGITELMASDEETQWVQVVFGTPFDLNPEDIIAFTSVTSEQNVATMGNRAREELLTITVEISCFRGGTGPDLEREVSDRAYYLLGLVERWCRVTDTTVGGTVRHCFLSGHESSGLTDPADLEKGRVIEITATFLAAARITG